jgi:hypothetical protein
MMKMITWFKTLVEFFDGDHKGSDCGVILPGSSTKRMMTKRRSYVFEDQLFECS